MNMPSAEIRPSTSMELKDGSKFTWVKWYPAILKENCSSCPAPKLPPGATLSAITRKPSIWLLVNRGEGMSNEVLLAVRLKICPALAGAQVPANARTTAATAIKRGDRNDNIFILALGFLLEALCPLKFSLRNMQANIATTAIQRLSGINVCYCNPALHLLIGSKRFGNKNSVYEICVSLF